MLSEQLTRQLLELPLPERVALAQALWQSIDEESGSDATDEEREALDQARKREAELSTGFAAGRTHQQVMEAARRILE